MYYVMSDIHGCYEQMIKALRHWNPEKEHLVIMGDMIDRGPDSLKVVRKAMELVEKYPEKVTILKGNHEDMLLSWLFETPEEDLVFYYSETHVETLKSFMGEEFKKRSRSQRATYLLHNHRQELNFMRSLTNYLETNHMVFVHAGLNLEEADWRDRHTDMLWIRNEFIFSEKIPEKRVFFGHTPTNFIHQKERNSNDIWISPCGNKIAIDGGVSMGGQLNTLKIDEDGSILESFIIK